MAVVFQVTKNKVHCLTISEAMRSQNFFVTFVLKGFSLSLAHLVMCHALSEEDAAEIVFPSGVSEVPEEESLAPHQEESVDLTMNLDK